MSSEIPSHAFVLNPFSLDLYKIHEVEEYL
jgi:hypothetical protein